MKKKNSSKSSQYIEFDLKYVAKKVFWVLCVSGEKTDFSRFSLESKHNLMKDIEQNIYINLFAKTNLK